jgi:hypothetical protein
MEDPVYETYQDQVGEQGTRRDGCELIVNEIISSNRC